MTDPHVSTPEELAIILKYGSLHECLLYWWGRRAVTDAEISELHTANMWVSRNTTKKIMGTR